MKWTTTLSALFLSVAVQASEPTYESLEQFCLGTKADTAENCACGQKKADELLSKEEQQLLVRFMMEDASVMPIIMENPGGAEALLDKLGEITKACAA